MFCNVFGKIALVMEGIVLVDEGQPIAFAIGSRLTEDTFDIHFEKAMDTTDGSYAAINQAMLKIYIEGSEYDYNKIEPIAMADKLNSSLTRLGIYTDYKTLTPIPDYLYSQESSGVLYFNGYMNRSLACYEMNISSYIQSLVNEVLNMEENADGTLDFSKLVIPRKLYLAPEAYDGFSFKRSIIQGSDEKTNPASIQLELTYTLVK